MNEVPYKTYLAEDELPGEWYNLRADMKAKPAPMLNPATLQPVTAAIAGAGGFLGCYRRAKKASKRRKRDALLLFLPGYSIMIRKE